MAMLNGWVAFSVDVDGKLVRRDWDRNQISNMGNGQRSDKANYMVWHEA